MRQPATLCRFEQPRSSLVPKRSNRGTENPACLPSGKTVESKAPGRAKRNGSTTEMDKNRDSLLADSLEQDEQALLRLIRVTAKIEGHLDGLDYAWMLSSPSQNYPSRAKKLIRPAEKQLGSKSSEAVLEISKNSETVAIDSLSALLDLTNAMSSDSAPYSDHTLLSEDAQQKLSHAVSYFGKSTAQCLSERVLLQDRGVVLPAVKFKISHSLIGEQIHELQLDKASLRDKISEVLNKVHSSISRLFSVTSDAPTEQKPETLNAVERLQRAVSEGVGASELQNLAEDLSFEGLDRSLPAKSPESEMKTPENPAPQGITAKEPSQGEISHPATQRSFMKKIWLWLNSPWKTKWKDL